MFLFFGIANGMVTGFTVLTSQRYGAKDEDGVKQTVTNGAYLCILVALIQVTLSVVFMKDLLTLMNTPQEIFDDAYAYISTICMGMIATIFYNYSASLMRAICNSKIPLFLLMIAAGLNVILDLVFIIVFGLGTFGAAFATVLSQTVSAVLAIIYIAAKVPVLKPQARHWKIHGRTAGRQIVLGLPMALQYGITASGTVIMQSAINRFGAVAVTAVTATNKFQGLSDEEIASMSVRLGSEIRKRGYRVMVCGGTEKTLPILMQDLQESGIDCAIADEDSKSEAGKVLLMRSGLSAGFEYPAVTAYSSLDRIFLLLAGFLSQK